MVNNAYTTPVCGYLEGYYGKLLSWTDRTALLNCLAELGLSTYCYAPKEDTLHRLHWRESYSLSWRQSFQRFCRNASEMNIAVVAGIAPGLDFNFDRSNSKNDFTHLLNKAIALLEDGASDILILWDDIEQNNDINRHGLSEGTAHATVVNQLSETINKPLWTVPRVYATEIENTNNYLSDYFSTLEPQHTTLLCGNAIVSGSVTPADLNKLGAVSNESRQSQQMTADTLKHRTVVWDNFYANDYCPRQVFLGPWTGRDQITDYLLNPTGLPYTDQLLLDIARSTHTSENKYDDWRKVLKRHGVPDAFQSIAYYFSHPFFGDRAVHGDLRDIDCHEPANEVDQAIEECLWKWKTPLAREWYPYIFGLKHDIALLRGTLPRHRVLKTQPAALAKRLLN